MWYNHYNIRGYIMAFMQPTSLQTSGTNPYTLLQHVRLPDPASKAQAQANAEYLKDKTPLAGRTWKAE